MLSLLLSFIVTCNPPELSKDTTEFASAVYQEIDTQQNTIFSPYSLFSCLSMVFAGAAENTAWEMHKALQLSVSQKALPREYTRLNAGIATGEFQVANALWADLDTVLLSDFSHTLQENYDAKFAAVDFSKTEKTVAIINEWISNQTHGKIQKLLEDSDIDKQTRLVLTNAVYFKGDWRLPFSAAATTKQPFHVSLDTVKDVPMMKNTAHFPYYESDQVQVLALPFKNGKTACLIVLPKEGQELSFSSALFKEWVCSLATENIAVSLPSFTIKSRFTLNDALQNLGMKEAFTPKANFSGIDGMRDLYVSKVVHEALFILGETGVVAAAATGATMNATGALEKKPPIIFKADHPFLFMIIDLKTQTPLFLGKLQDP